MRKSAFDGSKAKQGNASFQGDDWKGALQAMTAPVRWPVKLRWIGCPCMQMNPSQPLRRGPRERGAMLPMKLAGRVGRQTREVLYGQALKRAMSSAEARRHVRLKAHVGVLVFSRLLGSWRHANESRKLYEACKA